MTQDAGTVEPVAGGSGVSTASDLAGVRRRRELAEALARVRGRIEAACAAAGREPDEITVVAVTKTRPVEDVAHLQALGHVDVGENRAQEVVAKRRALGPECTLRWHFVGQVQTNKAAAVARSVDMVHSVDRASLVHALERSCAAADRTLDCLVQVALDGAAGRGGAPPDQVADLAGLVAAQAHLRVRGIMAVAPLGGDARAAFATLPGLLERVRSVDPEACVVSAGMSGDLEAAVAERSTHLRVGTAVLGLRS